jgi:hypothetical protein
MGFSRALIEGVKTNQSLLPWRSQKLDVYIPIWSDFTDAVHDYGPHGVDNDFYDIAGTALD